MRKLWALLFLLFPLTCKAQITNPAIIYASAAPTGTCIAAPPLYVVSTSGTIYTCDNGTWAASGGSGGSGTVTSVGSLSPLFTTTNATTTPTFTLNTQTANTVFAGPASGSAAAPTFRALVANDIPSTLNPTTFSSGGNTTFNGVANFVANVNMTGGNNQFYGSNAVVGCNFCLNYSDGSYGMGFATSHQLILVNPSTGSTSVASIGVYLGALQNSTSTPTNSSYFLSKTNLSMQAGMSLSWTSSTTSAGTAGSAITQDTGISRSAAGVISLDTTTAGNGIAADIAGVHELTVGTAVASASTIAPLRGIEHVTGTAAISTITPPTGMSSTVGGCITLIADGAWTTVTGGNIYAAMTAVAGTPYQFCYDGTTWYGK